MLGSDSSKVDKAATLTVESGSPAATLVDFFPSMKYLPTWLPFTNFKRNALETRKAVEVMFRVPYDLVIKDMVNICALNHHLSTNNAFLAGWRRRTIIRLNACRKALKC